MNIEVNTPDYSERAFDAGDYEAVGLGSFTATTGQTFYKTIGDSLYLHMYVTGTVGASTTFIGLNLPNSHTLKHAAIQLPFCTFNDTTGELTQKPVTPASGQLLIREADLSNFVTGTVSIYINIEVTINT